MHVDLASQQIGNYTDPSALRSVASYFGDTPLSVASTNLSIQNASTVDIFPLH
eukprot:gene11423-12770_t